MRSGRATQISPFIEQPLPADDLAGLKALARATKTPIGMDESIQSLADIETVKRAGAKGVSLKLIKLGGFREAFAAGKLCKKLGLKINVAAKIAEFEHRHGGCGASRLRGAERRLGRQPHQHVPRRGHRERAAADRGGAVALPDGPGLGVEVDEVAVARFRVQ